MKYENNLSLTERLDGFQRIIAKVIARGVPVDDGHLRAAAHAFYFLS